MSYTSISEFSLPSLGKCRHLVNLDDYGNATIEISVNGDTKEQTTSLLNVPNGLLDKLLTDVLRLANMERVRKGNYQLEFADANTAFDDE